MEGVQVAEIFSSSTEEEMEEDEEGSWNEDTSCSSLELESQDEMLIKSFQSYVVESGLVFEGPRQQEEVKDKGEGGQAGSGDVASSTQYHPVPLKSVRVEAALVHAVGQVQVTQLYRNEEEVTIDAIFVFPLDSNGAVTHFHAELDGRIVKGVVKPKTDEESKPPLKTPTAEDEPCLYVTGEEKKTDIFKVRIGHLKAGQEVKVVVGYVTEVRNEPDTHSMRFFLPTAITPRRLPCTKTVHNGYCSLRQNKNKQELGMTDEAVAPLSIKVIASIQGEIKSVECLTHKVVVENKGEIAQRPKWHKAIVTLDGLTTDMDRDFILLITPEEPIKPRIYAETLHGSTALMTFFVPSFKMGEQKTELFLVVDRSESMAGRNIELAKESLKLLLHSLPSDCYFNIVGFGSNHHFMFKGGSRRCSDKILKDAMNYVNKIHANMGGSELMGPLQKIYEKPLIPGYFRQTVIITDGVVYDTASIFGLVKINVHISRVFTIGVGSAPSHHLLEGIAKAGTGTCAFIESDSSICKQTLGQLKNLLQPSLNDVKIVWDGMSSPQVLMKTLDGFTNGKRLEDAERANSKCRISPRIIPPIFDGTQLLAFGIFEGNENPTGANITVNSQDGPLTLDLKLSEENDLGKTKMLHRLAAVKMVRDLELEECATRFLSRPRREPELARIKDSIITLAIANGISSKYTSFIAIDGTDESENDNSLPSRTRNVPSRIPYGYNNHLGAGHDGCAKRCAGKVHGMKAEKILRLHLGVQRLQNGHGKRPLASGAANVGKNKRKSSPSKKVRREESETDIEPMDTTTMDDVRSEEHHLLQNLIGLQSSQGSFELNSSFASLLSLDLETLKEDAGNKKWDESAWATVLAIRFFKTKLFPFKDLWDFVVATSQKWIVQNHLSSTDAMIARAKVLLKQNALHLNSVQ